MYMIRQSREDISMNVKLQRRFQSLSPLGLSPGVRVGELQNRARRFSDDVFGPHSIFGSVGWMPMVELAEDKDELALTAELPGVGKDDVNVEVEDGVLTIRGEKHQERTEGGEDRDFHVWERSYGAFMRSFTLPRAVDAEKITAGFRDGVLKIRLPKTKDARTRGRRISIGEDAR
jgi:HSP20 family protein